MDGWMDGWMVVLAGGLDAPVLALTFLALPCIALLRAWTEGEGLLWALCGGEKGREIDRRVEGGGRGGGSGGYW